MSTAEITAYLWGAHMAEVEHHLAQGDPEWHDRTAVAPLSDLGKCIAALGPDLFWYWRDRGKQEWRLEHGPR